MATYVLVHGAYQGGWIWQRVVARLMDNIDHGADPAAVANVVARAATSPAPRLHYQAGREARLLRILRSIAPAALLDKGIRKEFGLGVAS